MSWVNVRVQECPDGIRVLSWGIVIPMGSFSRRLMDFDVRLRPGVVQEVFGRVLVSCIYWDPLRAMTIKATWGIKDRRNYGTKWI